MCILNLNCKPSATTVFTKGLYPYRYGSKTLHFLYSVLRENKLMPCRECTIWSRLPCYFVSLAVHNNLPKIIHEKQKLHMFSAHRSLTCSRPQTNKKAKLKNTKNISSLVWAANPGPRTPGGPGLAPPRCRRGAGRARARRGVAWRG